MKPKMKTEWTLTLTVGLLVTALLSVALHMMQAPRSDQAALWIIGSGISALWSLHVSMKKLEQEKYADENDREHGGQGC